MSWKDFLLEASFRGARFYIESSDTGVGRRTKLHTYFRRSKPYLQDLGVSPDDFEIEGYIIQNSENDFNHLSERDALIKALKTDGAGILIHPYYGEIKVGLLEPARIRETTSEGGIARFTMKFVQAGERGVDTTRDYSTWMDDLVALLRAKGLDDFVDAYAAISEMAADITAVMNTITGAINTIRNGISSAIAAATGAITGILNTLDTIIDSPCDIAGALLNGTDAILNVVGMGDEILTGGAIGGCSGLRDSEKDTSSLSGESSEVVLDGTEIPESLGISVMQAIVTGASISESDLGISGSDVQTENRKAVLNITKLGLFANASKIGMRINFSSQDKLVENTELIADAMNNFLLTLGESNADDLYDATEELRSTFVRFMYEKGKDLTKIVEWKVPPGVHSTLVLAYNRYEDITRCPEIFEKNKPSVRHPGFMPGGEPMEILDE